MSIEYFEIRLKNDSPYNVDGKIKIDDFEFVALKVCLYSFSSIIEKKQCTIGIEINKPITHNVSDLLWL